MARVKVVGLAGETTDCDLAEVMKRASFRDDQDCNYIVVFLVSGRRFPFMIVYFKGECAVVVYFQDEDSGTWLLTSDSSTDIDEIEFLSPFEGYDTFTGDFIVSSATAVKFLEAFATGAPWPELPFWETL
jgi:hypothetical protein